MPAPIGLTQILPVTITEAKKETSPTKVKMKVRYSRLGYVFFILHDFTFRNLYQAQFSAGNFVGTIPFSYQDFFL